MKQFTDTAHKNNYKLKQAQKTFRTGFDCLAVQSRL